MFNFPHHLTSVMPAFGDKMKCKESTSWDPMLREGMISEKEEEVLSGSGSAISDGNDKSHWASTAAGQRSNEDESHNGIHDTFGFDFHLLHTWGIF